MIVYSKKIHIFVNEIKDEIRRIISKEMGLNVTGNRFFDSNQRFSYPISVVIYNNKTMLGYFDPSFYELGFHECLMHSKELSNIIRHELAHYMTFINYGSSIQSHGTEFKAFCQKMGWEEQVYRATICLDDGRSISRNEESSILRKVQKLMALTTSSNQNEAEQALIKSQQLLLKHNMEWRNIDTSDDEKIFLKRIMKQKKEDAKMRSIARILETFFVTIVYRRGGGFIYLEILGEAMNLEIAEYVANTLHQEFDLLWEQVKKTANLKGVIAKNSFFQGIAKGYCNKIYALKREYNSEITHSLMVIQKKLMDAKALVYPRLSTSKSHAQYCPESSNLGEQIGMKLNINPAVRDRTEKTNFLLTGQTPQK